MYKSTRVDNRAQKWKENSRKHKTIENVASTLSSREDKFMCVKCTEKRKRCRMRKDGKEATNRTKQKMKRREMLFLPLLTLSRHTILSRLFPRWASSRKGKTVRGATLEARSVSKRVKRFARFLKRKFGVKHWRSFGYTWLRTNVRIRIQNALKSTILIFSYRFFDQFQIFSVKIMLRISTLDKNFDITIKKFFWIWITFKINRESCVCEKLIGKNQFISLNIRARARARTHARTHTNLLPKLNI